MLEGFYETGVTAVLGLRSLGVEGATVGKNQSCISHNEEYTISPIVWGPCEAMQD